MKRLWAFLAFVVAAATILGAGSIGSAAPGGGGGHGRGSTPTLPAPATITCGHCESATVAWSPVDGAKGYSVEFIAGYDTNFDSAVDATLDFTYDVQPQNGNSGDQVLVVSLADFLHDFGTPDPNDPNGVPISLQPIGLQVHVKALNPPVKGGSQDNPFSTFCDVLATSTCDPNSGF